MQFGSWALSNPAGLWLTLLTLPIIALHILKPRRVRRVVAAVLLWDKVERPVTAARPWQRLIPSWLLAAQILACLLLALAVARPVRLIPLALGEHTIFVIDASASTQAVDGTPTRLDDAAARAKELRRQVPAGGEASLITAGQRARAVLTRSTDIGAFDEAVDAITSYDGAADFDDAFALAAGLNVGDRPTRVVFVSDGGIGADDLRTIPDGTRYERVGTSATNRGISQLAVEPSADGGLVARLTVRHYGGPAATLGLRLDVDGVTVEQRTVELDVGTIENLSIAIPPGDRIEAFLDSEDAYDLDDRFVATVSRRAEINVVHVGPPNTFLETALAVVPGLSLVRLETFADPANPDVARPELEAADVVIADRVAIPDDLAVPTWAIAPPDGAAGVAVSGEVERPALTLIQTASPVVAGLDLSEVLLARSQKVELPANAELILGAPAAPLLADIGREPARLLYQSFVLDESTLPLQTAFPVMVDRILSVLAETTTPPARVAIGERLPINSGLEASITAPDGTTTSLSPGANAMVADRVGFWKVEQAQNPPLLVAVAPEAAESNIQPAVDLPIAQEFNRETGQGTQAEIPVVRWLLAALLALLAGEWLLARRRIGVSATQWQVAQFMRAGVAVCLVAALFNLGFNRSSDEVATLFVIDASESARAEQGRNASYVAEALAAKPEGAEAGVIAFGRNARLDQIVSADPLFSSVSVRVDADGTDLSAALRLAAASLPTDARGRIVVLTDGKTTAGDLGAEVDRLVLEGVPVDLIAATVSTGTDVAVTSIDVPSSARVGERVTVVASIESPVATAAEVTLRLDGVPVETTSATLNPGSNAIRFSNVVADGAASVLRYQVDVNAVGDRQPQNNRSYAAVPIVGAERVLIIDGTATRPNIDEVGPLTDALRAVALPFDVRPVAGLPPIDELVRYSSIVLVNVDNFELSSGQVDTLTTAVRDLGRGMVVIGGRQSYALGGYRESDLEALLPVISEVTDPLRRQTVAEVFAIDTSGSMGACHCDENGENGLGGGNRIDGGVTKTAIARNATAKAIAALSATDEVGVVTMDNSDQWVIDLQASPSQDTIEEGLSQLRPDGPTFLATSLDTAAIQLRESNAALKHIILFSDGFTEPSDMEKLAKRAGALYTEEGITVSVVATGEGAAEDLRPVAEAGGGRFYAGRNLEQVPDLLVQEAIVASRSFINEGEFLPTVTSNARTVRNLGVAPVINGYLATTAKGTARVDLRIGPDQDPLLASWRTGLGRVTTWLSDSGSSWNAPWAGWDGSPDFWGSVIEETFPTATDGGGISATIDGDRLALRLEGVESWDDNAQAMARVTSPDGESREVPLERLDGSTFATTVDVDDAGVYAIGASVTVGSDQAWSGIGLSTRSYPAEFSPATAVDPALDQMTSATGGRLSPAAIDAFSADGTKPGQRRLDLGRWLLFLAALAWPLAVAVSRLAWRPGVAAVAATRAASTVNELQRKLPKIDRPAPRAGTATSEPIVEPPTEPRVEASGESEEPDSASDGTLDQLLAGKRRRRS